MAFYDNRQNYSGRPQDPRPQPYGQERYDLQPQRSHDPAFQQRTGGGSPYDYQNDDRYRDDRQYADRQAPVQQQRFNQVQRAQTAGPEQTFPHEHPQQQQQQQRPERRYQYDERYRTDPRGGPQRGGREHQFGRQSPPQMRPGTSASDRRPKIDRILDSDDNSPKAVPWDNPFGVFPGSKKDVEERKKMHEGDGRDRSKAGTPSSLHPPGPNPSSPRRPTTADSGAPRIMTPQTFDGQRPDTSHGRKPLSSTARIPPKSSEEMPPGRAPSDRPSFQEQSRQGSWNATDPYTALQNGAPTLALPERPAAGRSVSGPNPQRQPTMTDERVPSAAGIREADQSRRYFSDNADRGQPQPYRDNMYPQRGLDNETKRNGFSNYTVRSPRLGVEAGGQQPPQMAFELEGTSNKSYGDLSYRGRPSDSADGASMDQDTSDFAARAPLLRADTDRNLSVQTTTPYRKPTFGEASAEPIPSIRSPIEDNVTSAYSDRTVWSPSHDDEHSAQPYKTRPRDAPPRPPPELGYDAHGRYQQPLHGYAQQQYPDGHADNQGSKSQTDLRTAQPPSKTFTHPYNQPPMTQQLFPPGQSTSRPRPPHSQQPQSPQIASRQDYGFDERGYPIDYSRDQNGPRRDAEYREDLPPQPQYEDHPRMQRTFTAPVDDYQYDQYNHGYHQDPRANAQSSRIDLRYPSPNQPYPQTQAPIQQGRPPYDQNEFAGPPRPRTANSLRTPVNQAHDPLPVPPHPQVGLPESDRAHPAPVRPGLMMPPAPSPAPTSASMPVGRVSGQNLPLSSGQQLPQTLSQSVAPGVNQPVTTKELNELREAFKTRPNDAQLGLKFARKLVEAAKVLSGEGGRADPKQTAKNRERYVNDAYRIVKKLVAGGSPEAMFYLADCYGQGQLGLEVDAKEAFALYTSAAKMNHAQSAYRVAVCCELGHQEGGGTRRDHVKAVQFYKRAATLGDPPAMYKMGMVLLKGLLGQQANPREGISWLKRAAERADQENPHALHELGLLYESAKSTDVILRDEAYALQLFNSSAKLGYKYSQHRLGSAYEYGTLGCPIDPRQSIHWYSEAAKQQEHQSEFALSGWYLTGSPPLLEQSDTEAYLWARKAATSGLGKAEYAMGYYSEVGIGVKPDVEEAKKWYFRAAAQGDLRARERLEELKRGAGRRKRDRVSRSEVSRKNEGECNVM